MGIRGKPQATVLGGKAPAEESAILDELPDLRRQVVQFVSDLPVITHATEVFHRSIQKGLLVGRQSRFRRAEQFVPVRLAAEQLAIPPDCARIERDRKSTRLNSSHQIISYAVFCLKKKKKEVDYMHTILTCLQVYLNHQPLQSYSYRSSRDLMSASAPRAEIVKSRIIVAHVELVYS